MAKAKAVVWDDEVPAPKPAPQAKGVRWDEPGTGGSGPPLEVSPMPIVDEPAPVPAQELGLGDQLGAALGALGMGLSSNWSRDASARLASMFPGMDVPVGALVDRLMLNVPGIPVPPGARAKVMEATTPRPGTYQEKKQEYIDLYDKRRKAYPGLSLGSEIGGGIIQATSPLGQSTFLGRPGVGPGMASGALAGLGANETGDFTGQAEDMIRGGLFGGIASTAGPVIGRGVGRGLRWLGDVFGAGEGVVRPTPEAQALMDRGVRLTLGQQDPGSSLGQLEAVGTGTSWFGPNLTNLREAGMDSWRDAVMREGMPPNMPPPDVGMPPAQQQARAYEGFGDEYDKFRSLEVPPYVTEEVPGKLGPDGAPLRTIVNLEEGAARAAQDPGIVATADLREAVDKFLKNQLTKVPKEAYEPGGRVSFGVLQDMRSDVRAALRQALSGSSPNYKEAGLLANAEDYLTSVIESGLPAEAQAALKAADTQYAKHKILEEALYRVGDQPSGLTPAALEAAIKKATAKGGFARGTDGGELRALEQPARKVFQPPVRTGWALLSGTPGVQNFVTGPAAYAANRFEPLRNLALGRTGIQGAVRNARQDVGTLAPLIATEGMKAGGRSMLPNYTVRSAPRQDETEQQKKQREQAEALKKNSKEKKR